MSFRQELLQFVRGELARSADSDAIDETTQLIEHGVIDSIALMRMVTFIEERTGVRVPDEEVVPGNFVDIVSIEALVDRLRSQSS